MYNLRNILQAAFLFCLLQESQIYGQNSTNDSRGKGHEAYQDFRYIIGGIPADPREFAHMARLGHRSSANITYWFCGGSLISHAHVLTAAHCFYSENGEVNVVRLGELDFASDTDDADPEDFNVGRFTEHPEYKYPWAYNDIAVVQLERGVSFSFYKFPACLPLYNDYIIDSYIATGWGTTKFAGQQSELLRKVDLNEFGSNCSIGRDIDELPNGYNASTQLCIGSAESKDTCNGDSGGPLLIPHKKLHMEYPCKYLVMGITSIGIGCGTPNKPSFYTRVHFYSNWIQQKLGKFAL